MRVGGKGRVRGPGEACAAGCAGQGAVARAAGAGVAERGARERKGGARSTGAERAERRGVARSGRAAEEEGSECASAAKAECAGQGRHARPGARARGQWRMRPALIAVGGRAMRRWRGKRERESEVRSAKKER